VQEGWLTLAELGSEVDQRATCFNRLILPVNLRMVVGVLGKWVGLPEGTDSERLRAPPPLDLELDSSPGSLKGRSTGIHQRTSATRLLGSDVGVTLKKDIARYRAPRVIDVHWTRNLQSPDIA
jgi:hypothetical protein